MPKRRRYSTRGMGRIQSSLSLSTKRALPSSTYMRTQNGPVITRIPRTEPDTGQGTLTTPTFAEPTRPKDGMVSSLPSHLKCADCAYIATSKADFDIHWLNEHGE